MANVNRATDNDLTTIFTWLKVEYDEDGGNGFWCNRRIIERSHKECDDLYVIRQNGEAVSFQVGNYGPVITSTKKAFRHKGYATALLNESIHRVRRDDVNVLDIECSPRESWDYWRSRGFQRYGDMSDWGKLTARMVLCKQLNLPTDRPCACLMIEFYPEEVKYEENVSPLYGWTFDSALLLDGSYQLPIRALGLKDDLESGDMVIRIQADGQEIYFGKAKYEGAKAVGVIDDWNGGCFYVDRVTPVPTAPNLTNLPFCA